MLSLWHIPFGYGLLHCRFTRCGVNEAYIDSSFDLALSFLVGHTCEGLHPLLVFAIVPLLPTLPFQVMQLR